MQERKLEMIQETIQINPGKKWCELWSRMWERGWDKQYNFSDGFDIECERKKNEYGQCLYLIQLLLPIPTMFIYLSFIDSLSSFS